MLLWHLLYIQPYLLWSAWPKVMVIDHQPKQNLAFFPGETGAPKEAHKAQVQLLTLIQNLGHHYNHSEAVARQCFYRPAASQRRPHSSDVAQSYPCSLGQDVNSDHIWHGAGWCRNYCTCLLPPCLNPDGDLVGASAPSSLLLPLGISGLISHPLDWSCCQRARAVHCLLCISRALFHTDILSDQLFFSLWR